MKFKRKPIEVEACQFVGGVSFGEMCEKWGRPFIHCAVANDRKTWIEIDTLEGILKANKGDWIIKGIAGEFYPCKDEIFKKSYEPVA